MKLEIKTARSEQTAIPELNKESKTLYYLIIGEGTEKIILNIGEKTYTGVQKLTENEKTQEKTDTDKINKSGSRKTA